MFTDVGLLKVRYSVQGEGKPLLLLHSGSTDLDTWEEMIPDLAKYFTVYRMDLRGFGLTSRSAEPRLSIEVWTDDLRAFMDRLGVSEAALVGWSLGGAIILKFAALYPERVRELILLGSLSPLANSDFAGWRLRARLASDGVTVQEMVEQTFESTKMTLSPHTREKNPAAVEKVRQTLLRNQPLTYIELVDAMKEIPSLKPALDVIRAPTLILVGDSDIGTPISSAEDLNKALPSSFLKIIPDCGHCYPYEQPAATSKAIVEFIRAFDTRVD